MATVPDPYRPAEPLYSLGYIDILGHVHDTREIAEAASYRFLLAEELAEHFALPADPRHDGARAGVAWFAANFDTATEALPLAVQRLLEKGVAPPSETPEDDPGGATDGR